MGAHEGAVSGDAYPLVYVFLGAGAFILVSFLTFVPLIHIGLLDFVRCDTGRGALWN